MGAKARTWKCSGTLKSGCELRATAHAQIRTLGEYDLVAKLGEGGMGIVYSARDARLQLVALKTLLPHLRNNSRAAIQIRREIVLALRLDHANVVRSVDAGESQGIPFLVMEHLDGANVSDLSVFWGTLPVCDACEIVRQMALGVHHIHEHGAVHRDIKPGNAMLTNEGVVKILDVGLALLQRETYLEAESLTGQVVGSFDYMAPEQAYDSRSVGPTVDLYGLGATLFQLLSGHPPFSGADLNSPMKKLHALAGREAPSVSERRPDVPEEVAAIVARLLSKDPAERFATAAELASALAVFTEGSNLCRLLNAGITGEKRESLQLPTPSTSNDNLAETIYFAR